MPTYEVHCPECSAHYDIFQAMSAEGLPACRNCGKETLQKQLTAPGVIMAKQPIGEDDAVRRHYGLKKGERVYHSPDGDQTVYKFERGTPEAKIKDTVRRDMEKNGKAVDAKKIDWLGV